MYLYIGQDTVIQTDSIIGIFDLDNTTVSKITRETLRKTDQKKETVTVGFDLPKSFIVCADENGKQTVYLSSVTPATLVRRIQKKNEFV